MIRNQLKFFVFFIFVILSSCSENEGNHSLRISLSGDWMIRSSTQVEEDGARISSDDYHTDGWLQAVVPTTVLRALVNDSIYPDPRIGMNNFLIPDASDSFNRKHDLGKYSYLDGISNPWKDPYWFRKDFSLPSDFKGKHLELRFDGINYRADVWLNGKQIAGRQEMAGMFRRFRYDITNMAGINKKNHLAVKIYQVDHPGLPDPGVQFKVFGWTRGHAVDIFRDETLKFSGGWDCAPVIRDRNMGIYEDVYISATGPVSIEDPFVITDLPLPDTSYADIKIVSHLVNHTDKDVRGILSATISLKDTLKFPTYDKCLGGSMKDITIRHEITVPAGGSVKVNLDPGQYSSLRIRHPHLWWPNGYGKQYLHNLRLTFQMKRTQSDESNTLFGIREVRNELKKIDGEYGRVFYINGVRVFCRGGWLQPDALLNYDKKRIYDEARLLANANVNMVASEDAPSPPDEVLEAYDKYGLMCWETFYQCWRMRPGGRTANNPDDHSLALNEAEDIIKRYRNHPSLVVWCVANETTVAEDIYTPLRKYVFDLDGTRPFIPASNIDWDVDKLTPYIKADLPLGTTDNGQPDYNWNPESYYFDKILEVKYQTFRNELGVPSVPVYATLEKSFQPFNTDRDNPLFPLDSIWAEHGAWDGDNYAFRAYDNAIRTRYGMPESVKDYAFKAQLVNANSYRAMFEAANHRMWDITSGVMLWKLNSCWPTVLWQIYDWYLDPDAAYYFTQNALEPVHIQMNANSRKISVINTRHTDPGKLVAGARILDLNMNEVWARADTISAGADRYMELFTVPENLPLTAVYFVNLELKKTNGEKISENTYWQSVSDPPDFSILTSLDPVDVKLSASAEDNGKEYHVTVTIENPSGNLSFFNRLEITKGERGEEILPSFWSANYITLFPGDKKTLKVYLAKDDLEGEVPYVRIDGNNAVAPVRIRTD